MASIHQRPTGFQVQFRRKGYKPIPRMFSTKDEPESWLRKIEADVDS
jgi:hypothetical protein